MASSCSIPIITPKTSIREHTDSVPCVVCFNAKNENNRQMLVYGGGNRWNGDYIIRVCDLVTNNIVAKLNGHSINITALHVFEDVTTGQQHLVSGSQDGTIIVWSLETYERIKIIEICFTDVNFICSFVDREIRAGAGVGARKEEEIVSSEETSTVLVFASAYGAVRLWNIDSRKCTVVIDKPLLSMLHIFSLPMFSICTFVDDDDNRMLVISTPYNKFCIWDVKKKKCVRMLDTHSKLFALFSSNICIVRREKKKFIASGNHDQTIRLWDVNSGKCESVLTGHDQSVINLALFSISQGNSILASGSWDITVRMWDVESLTCLAVLKTNSIYIPWSYNICCLSFAKRLPDDRVYLLSGSFDNTIAVWDVTQIVKQVCYRLSYHTFFLHTYEYYNFVVYKCLMHICLPFILLCF